MLPASYFGFMTDRTEHDFVRSLVLAVFFGAFFGLAMAGLEERNGAAAASSKTRAEPPWPISTGTEAGGSVRVTWQCAQAR